MRAVKVQASLRIRAVSPEPSLLAHTSSESRGTFRQKARTLAPLNGWACAVKICHDGMLEDTNSLDGAHLQTANVFTTIFNRSSSSVFPFALLINVSGNTSLGTNMLFGPCDSSSLVIISLFNCNIAKTTLTAVPEKKLWGSLMALLFYPHHP